MGDRVEGLIVIPWARDGLELVAQFTAVEAAVLSDTMWQAIDLMQSGAGEDRDHALDRLLPNAYPDDPDAAAAFRQGTEGSLLASKIRNAQTVILGARTDAPVRLTPSEVQSWLRALTDARLILASRLGIEHDDDPGNGDPYVTDVYQWFGYLQASMLEAMEA